MEDYQGELLGYGQSSFVERKYVYNAVIDNCYSNILECGTMEGGGTTYAIFRALQKMGYGKLTTYEIDEGRAKIAAQKYNEYVEVKNESYENTYKSFAPGTICMVMYDNIRNDDLNERLFKISFELIRPGGSLIIHDWTADHSQLFMKTYKKTLEQFMFDSSEWSLIQLLNDTTGLAHFKKSL